MDLDVLKEKIRHGKLDVNDLDNALLLRFQSLIIQSGCSSFASLGICFFSCAGGCTKGGTKN